MLVGRSLRAGEFGDVFCGCLDAFTCFLTGLLLVFVLSFLSSLPFLLPSKLTISPLRLPYWGLLVLKHD